MTTRPAPRMIELPPLEREGEAPEAPITLEVIDSGPSASGPAVVFSHGFPELAHSWRHQYGPLVQAGYRVIMPNQRGYGASSAPAEVERYDIDHLTGDLVGLLDALGIEQAIFVGHDWGGFVVWAMPILHPERTLGVVGVNTPYTERTPIAPTQAMRFMAGDDPDSIYILWFQEPGVAEAQMDRHCDRLFDMLFQTTPSPAEAAEQMAREPGVGLNPFRSIPEIEIGRPCMLSDEDLRVYKETFGKTGFRGGISWYRNFDRNWERHPEIGVARIEVPALMVTAEWDLVLPPSMAETMSERCGDLEIVMIESCGHWTQQEKPERLNAILLDWLSRRFR